MNQSELRLLNILGAFCFAVSDRISAATNKALGMNASYPSALVQIGLFSDKLSNLQSALSMGQSAATRLVQKLEEMDLVYKARSPDDSRSATLHLTEQGEREMRRILQERYTTLEQFVSPLSGDEKAVFLNLISKILEGAVSDRQTSDSVCRLCDLNACPQDRCPAAH
ncbi:MarR family transcriptional regulator [Brenneria populi subsp. brevivirga]|uniref:MarR family winged helix-turn-helix transcriptional regulator n=1 Tax=Brenneria populi TaxID=1505588 RepID=UPI002E187010|nr:MarR family transcriptional regulator [Brenneria populi subsp. brevivirga]